MTWPTLASVRLATRLEFTPKLARAHRFVRVTVDGKQTNRWTRVLCPKQLKGSP